MINNISIKVNEYLRLGIQIGLFDNSNIDIVREKLKNISIVEDNSLTGDAEAIIEEDKKIIKINSQKCRNKEYYFMDEVLFHEFTHFINEIHNDLFNSLKSQIIAFKNKYSSSLKNDELAQYPEWGGILLDEAISQKVAQTMVETKYGKRIYERHPKKSKIFGEEMNYYSSFSDYPEFENIAEKFSKSCVGSAGLLGLAKLSMSKRCIDSIFTTYSKQSNGGEKLYKSLAYMGNIAIADYASKGHFILKNSENLRRKENVVKSYHLASKIIEDVLSRQGFGLDD